MTPLMVRMAGRSSSLVSRRKCTRGVRHGRTGSDARRPRNGRSDAGRRTASLRRVSGVDGRREDRRRRGVFGCGHCTGVRCRRCAPDGPGGPMTRESHGPRVRWDRPGRAPAGGGPPPVARPPVWVDSRRAGTNDRAADPGRRPSPPSGWRRSAWCCWATGRAAPSTSSSGSPRSGPMLVAVAAVRWPPVARGDRAFAGIAWLALGRDPAARPVAGRARDPADRAGPADAAPLARGRLPVAARPRGDRAVRRPRAWRAAAWAAAADAPAAPRHGRRARRWSWSLVAGHGVRDGRDRQRARAGRPARRSRRGSGPRTRTSSRRDCIDPVVAGRHGAPAAPDGRLDRQPLHRARWSSSGIRDGADVSWTGFAATRLTLGQQGLVRVGEPRLGALTRPVLDRAPTRRAATG